MILNEAVAAMAFESLTTTALHVCNISTLQMGAPIRPNNRSESLLLSWSTHGQETERKPRRRFDLYGGDPQSRSSSGADR